jgi:sec-independent protein translocase protein TatA
MNLLPCLAISMPGPGEWIVILAIVVLLFGAKRLPDLARSLGKSLSEFKKGKDEGLQSSTEVDKKEETGDQGRKG